MFCKFQMLWYVNIVLFGTNKTILTTRAFLWSFEDDHLLFANASTFDVCILNGNTVLYHCDLRNVDRLFPIVIFIEPNSFPHYLCSHSQLSRRCWVSRSRPRVFHETITVISLWRHKGEFVISYNEESIATHSKAMPRTMGCITI